MKENANNYFGANCSTSSLKNKIIDDVWECLGVDICKKLKESGEWHERESYYKLNNKISEAIDKYVQVLSCQYHISKEQSHYLKQPERIKGLVTHQLTSQIADALIKSEFVVMQEFNSNFSPDIIYKVEIPFIKAALT